MRFCGQTLARVATLINSYELSSSFDQALRDWMHQEQLEFQNNEKNRAF